MIVDLTNARRAYLMSQVARDYRFYLHSPRKIISTENERELKFVQKYCPEILSKKVSFDEVTRIKPDTLIVTSVSMYFKEFDKKLVNLVNAFQGQWIAVDYAWEAGRRQRKQKNRQFNRRFSHVAIAATSPDAKGYLPFSQPELDMYACVSRFVNRDSVLKEYGLPADKKIIIVTSGAKYEQLKPLVKLLSGFKKDIYVIWKLKFKQREYQKKVTKALASHGIAFSVIAGPKEKSHTDFLSPMCKFSVVAACHINLPSLSFSHAEMVRAGVPTYTFGKNGIKIPNAIQPMIDHFWEPKSASECAEFSLDVKRCNLIVDDLHCTKNLVHHCKG